ncbi:MAG TPA: hypothetical protein VIL88_09855 [Devosia sp.]|jgi:hypothetical protein|uniref:hypothetical protein n=1 Tax=Devosia sp. TaxID=1871048 RepID=UPI002F953580
MIKNTVLALVAAAAFAGVAAPAFAANNAFGDDSSPEMREFIADSVETQLRQKGIDVSAVEDWNGLVRAYVTLEDGSQTMQFFTPGSLEQVTF